MALVAWLMRDGHVLASLEEATTASSRMRGLLGRDGVIGAMLLCPARSVHTFGMRFAIDVAFCDAEMLVIDVVRMKPWRLALPRRRAHSVLEAEAGAFEQWGLRVGDQLEVGS